MNLEGKQSIIISKACQTRQIRGQLRCPEKVSGLQTIQDTDLHIRSYTRHCNPMPRCPAMMIRERWMLPARLCAQQLQGHETIG
jgi:hypothetical protein